MAETKRCPDCAEEVLAEANVCKHCGLRFALPPPPVAAPGRDGKPIEPMSTKAKVTIWSVVALIALAVVIYSAAERSNSDSSTGSSSIRTVTYKVGGTASSADITYSNASGDASQQSGVDVPLKRTTGELGIQLRVPDGERLYISAQNGDDSGTITCSIEVDGVEITTNRSSGGYTIATCSGQA